MRIQGTTERSYPGVGVNNTLSLVASPPRSSQQGMETFFLEMKKKSPTQTIQELAGWQMILTLDCLVLTYVCGMLGKQAEDAENQSLSDLWNQHAKTKDIPSTLETFWLSFWLLFWFCFCLIFETGPIYVALAILELTV